MIVWKRSKIISRKFYNTAFETENIMRSWELSTKKLKLIDSDSLPTITGNETTEVLPIVWLV